MRQVSQMVSAGHQLQMTRISCQPGSINVIRLSSTGMVTPQPHSRITQPHSRFSAYSWAKIEWVLLQPACSRLAA